MGQINRKRNSVINNVTTLSESEKDWWTIQIKDFRKKYIKPPMFYVNETITKLNYTDYEIRQNVEKLLIEDREDVYNLYLKDEAVLNAKLVSHLIDNREIPNEIFSSIVNTKILSSNLDSITPEELKKLLSETIGEYTGAVFPY